MWANINKYCMKKLILCCGILRERERHKDKREAETELKHMAVPGFGHS